MKRFHWGRDIGCLPSPLYHCSCMSDQLPMWHNAAYSVYYAQRQVSASLWNARAFSRSSYIKSVYSTNITLLLTWRLQSWHKGDCRASAHHHSLWQTAQCECQPVRGAHAVVAYLRDCPLTGRRNTQIQMYWLWKWLESYNNCTFSTWKDKFLFNLLFWIPDSFCTFHDYARGGTPFLASPDGPSLIFYHSDFWTTFLPWKTECALNSLYWIYIFYHSEFWTTCDCPEKQS